MKKNVFEISTISPELDKDSLSLTIKVDCSRPTAPITEENLETLYVDALDKPAENLFVNDYTFRNIQSIALNNLEIGGEKASDFIVGGEHGISMADVDWLDHVIVTNHGAKQYVIEIYYSGNRIIPDFGESVTELDDHILESIKFN